MRARECADYSLGEQTPWSRFRGATARRGCAQLRNSEKSGNNNEGSFRGRMQRCLFLSALARARLSLFLSAGASRRKVRAEASGAITRVTEIPEIWN